MGRAKFQRISKNFLEWRSGRSQVKPKQLQQSIMGENPRFSEMDNILYVIRNPNAWLICKNTYVYRGNNGIYVVSKPSEKL